MPHRVHEYNGYDSVHRMGGIRAIHPRIQGNSALFKSVHSVGEFTYPVIKAIQWILDNGYAGRTIDDENMPDDLDLLATIRGMRKSPGRGKEPMMTKEGELRQIVVDAYEDLEIGRVLEDLPTDPNFITRVDQLVIFGIVRWPVYALVHDSLHNPTEARKGAVRQWVFDEAERLGIGFPAQGPKKNDFAPGRHPIVMKPTSYGMKLIKFGNLEQWTITPEMRNRARRTPPSPEKHDHQMSRTQILEKRFLDVRYKI